MPGDRYPPAVLIGNGDCIQSGERPGDLTPGLTDGFDARCWAFQPVPPSPLVLAFDVTAPEHQLLLVQLMQQLYVNPALAASNLSALLGPGATVTVVPNTASPIPGTLIGRQGTLTVVITSGTSNPQQWALQPLTSFAGPINQGTYSTLPFWQIAASGVQTRILAVSPPVGSRFVFVGHSMGGAISHVLTAQYLSTMPADRIQLLTIGCPQPGDSRLVALTRQVTSVNLVNEADAVTALPPSGILSGWLSWLIPEPLRSLWGQWRVPANRVGLSPAGIRTTNPSPTDLFGLVSEAVAQVLLGRPVPTFTAHNVESYLQSLGGSIPPGGDVLPGTIVAYAGPALPVGYLPCDGSLVSRTVYADLFLALGTTWGAGDGVTTFTLPDLRGRTLIGAGTGPGLSPRALAALGGEEEHQLTVGELAAHGHAVTDPGHTHSLPVDNGIGALLPSFAALANLPEGAVNVSVSTTGVSLASTGGNAAHNNMQPFAVVLWAVKT